MSDVPNRAHDENRSALTAHTMLPAQEVLEGMFASINAPMVKDPFHGTVYADLSDPNHPFWKGGPRE
jgi:hypothetical protein